MPTKKQIIFATFRHIKERHPYFYCILGAKECFKVSKWIVENYNITTGNYRDIEIINNYICKYFRKAGYEPWRV